MRGMPMGSKYKAVMIGSDGKILDTIGLGLCPTDGIAVDAARTFAGAHTVVEVWDGERKVGLYAPAVPEPYKTD